MKVFSLVPVFIISFQSLVKANDISDGKIAPDPLKKLRIPTEIDDILQSISQVN